MDFQSHFGPSKEFYGTPKAFIVISKEFYGIDGTVSSGFYKAVA